MKRKQLRMKGKRALSVLTASVLIASELAVIAGAAFVTKPMTAQAENDGKVLVLGTGSIAAGDRIVYGKKAAELAGYESGNGMYRVLDASKDNAGGDNAMFVLSDNLWGNGGARGNVYFDNEPPYSNVYQGSDAQAWCVAFADAGFGTDTPERKAIRQINKDDGAYTQSDYHTDFATSKLDKDEVFFLSAEEADYYITGTKAAVYNGGNGYWWLRSPYALSTHEAGLVRYGGRVDYYNVLLDYAARPAFNINLQSVIFSSASEAGKSESVTPETIENGTNIGSDTNPWKLTLLTGNMGVRPGTAMIDENDDRKILLSEYTASGDYDRISVMITDKEWAQGNTNDAVIERYGKFDTAGKYFNLPEDYDIDKWGEDYFVYLIAENTHTGYVSDYAGMPTEVTAPGEAPVEPAKPKDNSSGNSSDKSSSSSHRHVHDYEWVLKQEATVYENGVYVYRCKGCGHEADSSEKDCTAALMNAMKKAIETAPENGTVRLDCGYYMSLNRAVAEAHDLRSDVTVVFTFLDGGVRKELTIPAGAALVPMLNDYGWAGFRCIAAHIEAGVTLEEVK